MRFKVESEGNLFDIYELAAAGEHTVVKGDHCSGPAVLVAWDVPAAEVENVPNFLDVDFAHRAAA